MWAFSFYYTVHSLINWNSVVTGTLFSAPLRKMCSFYCFCWAVFDLYWKNPVPLGKESCTSCWQQGRDSCIPVYQWRYCTSMCTLDLLHGCPNWKRNILPTIHLCLLWSLYYFWQAYVFDPPALIHLRYIEVQCFRNKTF